MRKHRLASRVSFVRSGLNRDLRQQDRWLAQTGGVNFDTVRASIKEPLGRNTRLRWLLHFRELDSHCASDVEDARLGRTALREKDLTCGADSRPRNFAGLDSVPEASRILPG